MEKNLKKESELILKMSINQQVELLKLIPKAVLLGNIVFYSYQKEFFYTLNQRYSHIDKVILNHISLVMAMNKFYNNLSTIEKNLMKSQKKCKALKKEQLFTHWALITELKEKNRLGFREIAKKLKRLINLTVSHVYIAKIYNQKNQK